MQITNGKKRLSLEREMIVTMTWDWIEFQSLYGYYNPAALQYILVLFLIIPICHPSPSHHLIICSLQFKLEYSVSL
jgi:hypothetical protein